MIKFNGELVVVTGAANGQGAAEARLFAELGARVIVSDFDFDGAKAVAESIGASAFPFKLDVSRETDWQEWLAQRRTEIKAFADHGASYQSSSRCADRDSLDRELGSKGSSRCLN